ncbi:PREDICTED: uncharacterized protein LOC104598222 isoform X1 [Nelumbo nucifera]|uniref:Uncharacterized protein LOC104598222 isoform X1 n=1 Tax=Nelumbo nucifera TaxID=4432 RepID=A0A1U8A8Z2_NELNU|nr:PREDICTED: uncharacterized protein LOC104598222 isoform X1 [Nelumbo nucifera]XP_010258450.1 PREDICTED: uncharacterized protein LOC104598222 isoform X1 [Nelumbo nucifera]XP_010258451.1 PREDICTED: uncharacterized protein LOC104598222 isoform X1 [Nelumbo nucifera]XP_010258453.1 PREDICTED: uncharacterized protein LOC104598222 isoform X1 [Nelumbo nucifera]
MLPVCSATQSCSYSQIYYHAGLRPFSSWKSPEVRYIFEDKVLLGTPHEHYPQEVSFKLQTSNSLCSHVNEWSGHRDSTEFFNIPPCSNELYDNDVGLSNNWSYSVGAVNETYSIGREDLNYVESSSVTAPEKDSLLNLPDQFMQSIDPPSGLESSSLPVPESESLLILPDKFSQSAGVLSGSNAPETISTADGTVGTMPENPTLVFNSPNEADTLSNMKSKVEDILSGFNASIDASVNKGELALKNTLDAIQSFLTDTAKTATGAVDNAINNVVSSVDQTGESATNRLMVFSGDLKETTTRVGVVAIDILRQTIVTVDDYLTRGADFVVYSYGVAKDLLPPEVLDVLNLSEEKAAVVLRPAGTAFKQVYVAIEGLERNLGLDPSDPILPFFLFLGTSATLGVSYWLFNYGGYSGDLSPKLTLELLTGEENAVLIDVRPEDLRERDGVPDLRRRARFRYASVTLPEIGGSERKLVKSGKELDDAIVAAVIRNLKIVRDRSKVLIMDYDGTRSKGIARSLRKFGVKRTYLVQGGFRSWVRSDLRIKELKPETTLTILNEEAEAILEDIKPSPLEIFGYGVGFVAALYALLEWEKTLQLIGVVGLGQTIYRRFSSYEDSEDFKEDVRLLLAPVRLGVQAFSWATGKLEPNRIGLPTSPSSSAVQDRVLQAAAKHESQPSDAGEVQDSSREATPPMNENVDLSEA